MVGGECGSFYWMCFSELDVLINSDMIMCRTVIYLSDGNLGFSHLNTCLCILVSPKMSGIFCNCVRKMSEFFSRFMVGTMYRSNWIYSCSLFAVE